MEGTFMFSSPERTANALATVFVPAKDAPERPGLTSPPPMRKR
jgi:hypothetical protein